MENEIAELRQLLLGMQNYNSITPEFKKVLERGNFGSSSKGSSSENVVVDESGVATYSVLGPPNGFDQATVNGSVHYYPYYT